MYPINVATEIENEDDLNQFFTGLKDKTFRSVESLYHYLVTDPDTYIGDDIHDGCYFNKEEREDFQKKLNIFLLNVGKLLEFSQKVEELETKNEVSNES